MRWLIGIALGAVVIPLQASANIQTTDCSPGISRLEALSEALRALSDVAAIRQSRELTLPPGEQRLEDLLDVVASMAERGETAAALFEILADGQDRSISGEVMRDLNARYWLQLDFLPLEDLVEIQIHDRVMDFTFDFGKHNSRTLRTAKQQFYVQTPDGPRLVTQDGKKIKVKDHFQVYLSESGLAGVRDGDFEVKWGPFWPNLQLRSEKTTRVAISEDGLPILKSDGNELVRDALGQVVPAVYTDWNIISVKDREVWLPMRPIRSQEIHVASVLAH